MFIIPTNWVAFAKWLQTFNISNKISITYLNKYFPFM